jgi:biopolymer transport protein ExbB/TolQ
VLLERGWVPHAIMMMACFAFAVLAVKAIGLSIQSRAFKRVVLPAEPAVITPDVVPDLIAHVEQQRPPAFTQLITKSFLLARVVRVLEHFGARGDVAEASAANTADSDADVGAVAGSFAIVKVLVWAIPILGFIGTVLGLGEAVGSFSQTLQSAESLDTIKKSLGEVTSGLAVAFDCTLVSLCASVLVMMPTSSLQKAEDQLVADVDDFILQNLLRRIEATKDAPIEPPPAEPHVETVRQNAEEKIAVALTDMLWAHKALLTKMADDHEALKRENNQLHEALSAFVAGTRHLAPAVEGATAGLVAANALLERTVKDAARTEEQLCREIGASRQLLQLLAAGLGGSPAPAAKLSASNGANGSHGAALQEE